MRTLIFLFFLIVAATGCTDHAAAQSSSLARFNHSPPDDDTGANESDQPLIAQFKDKPFVCRLAKDHSPTDSGPSAQAFNEFVQYVQHGDSIPDFWNDGAARKKRLDLINAAIKAGSWKAAYVDSVWAFRVGGDATSHQDAVHRLETLVRQGVPIAVYTYATYLEGDPEQQAHLMSEAIDRGSPNAMEWVGGNIVARSKQLRPVGKAMLDCALAQGDGNAYEALGMLADIEGRRVDAYRLWEKGVNSGCADCIGRMEEFAQIRDDFVPSRGMTDATPSLNRIKAAYSDNLFFDWTELPDFYRPLPANMTFSVTDDDILKLLTLQESRRSS